VHIFRISCGEFYHDFQILHLTYYGTSPQESKLQTLDFAYKCDYNYVNVSAEVCNKKQQIFMNFWMDYRMDYKKIMVTLN
jgi:hypothetical protein